MYAARKTLLTGTDILTDTSQARLDALFACPDHADVHATWRIYQDLLAAYRDRDPRRGKNTLRQLITTLTRPGLPHTCIELARMGRTLKRRARDILAYFDHPTPATAPPKPSTDASNTYAASPKDSSTTETTAYAASSTPADSNTSYTLKCEEPVNPTTGTLNPSMRTLTP